MDIVLVFIGVALLVLISMGNTEFAIRFGIGFWVMDRFLNIDFTKKEPNIAVIRIPTDGKKEG